MASLTSLPHSPPSVSRSSRTTCAIMCLRPSKIHTVTTKSPERFRSGKLSLVTRSALDEVSVANPPPPPPPSSSEPKPELIASLKLKLLSAVSGLNRGLAANEGDLQKADAAAKEIEDIGGLVDLSVDLDKLQGKWKLIYSSAFSSRTLGGSRPGPPTRRLLPLTLGQVFQRIDVVSKDFDNIVELELGVPWPLPPAELTATLAHKFELIGSAKIKIAFEKTTVKASGNLSQLPPFEIPRIPDALRPPSNTGSGEFEVTYLDADTRITRGDRDELRVFVIA
ncbi:putative plastid-lipid-associated protein 6, chloroplastic [Morella rubra]|uniref:Putative plastid-lipid-associated protein 6, chloroplastic n=1 Tax=Morella rubra TaxID=262757 RepID=A0A6A1W325_9ROSI|nr:putative plastid-lipid-associated protein 6, chloroplastic [Morella rubra]KAB1219293.1 putative plastid-lipid-associated protein 6, chloroplastic [Morella rubra]